jgi:hypothetical protein
MANKSEKYITDDIIHISIIIFNMYILFADDAMTIENWRIWN